MTCDAHFRTWPSYSSHKSCVKILFGLVEPFKSYPLNFLLGGGRIQWSRFLYINKTALEFPTSSRFYSINIRHVLLPKFHKPSAKVIVEILHASYCLSHSFQIIKLH